jgi:hypothetical protein
MSKVKVSVPGYVKDMAMMSAIRNCGKTDRTYIKSMASAVHSYNAKKNESLKKMTKDLSSDD